MAGAAAATRALVCILVRRVPICLTFGTGLESSVARGGQFPAFRRGARDSGDSPEIEVDRAVVSANYSV